MALIVTLGVLSVVALTVFAFLVSMRTERQAARNHLDRQICREYVRVGLIQAMETYVPRLLSSQQRVYPVGGWFAEVSRLDPNWDPEWDGHLRGECLGSFCQAPGDDRLLFRGAVTNLLPALLQSDARTNYAGWTAYITNSNQNPHAAGTRINPLDAALDGVTNGRISFLIINCSGFAPPEALADDATPAPHFLSQHDIPADVAGDVFHVAYDHNPYQRYERLDRLGTLDAGVTNRFDVNAWTNMPALADWLTNTTDALVACGYTPAGYTPATAAGTAQNLLDFMDADRLPLTTERSNPSDRTIRADPLDPTLRPCRVAYGLEDLPMLNEVAVTLTNAPIGEAGPVYSVAVELWYPFLPSRSPKRMELWVGVYTNLLDIRPFDSPCAVGDLTGPFGFTNELPQLDYPDRPFHVVRSPPSRRPRLYEGTNTVELSTGHPLWIQPRLFILDTNANAYVCVDEMLLAADDLPFTWSSTGSVQVRDPRNNLLALGGSAAADMSDWSDTPTLWVTNTNCTVPDVPFVHPNAPMSAIGEIGYVYVSGATGSVDFATAEGAATLDRFAVFPAGTNSYAARNRIQANSGYTNVLRRLFESVLVYDSGTTNKPAYAQPDGLAAAYQAALTNTAGRGWTCFRDMLPDVVGAITAAGQAAGELDARSPMLIEDLVRSLPDRVTFRQNVLVVLLAAQRLSPLGKPIADQRAAVTVVRDAYTGGWFVHDWYWLND